MIFLALATLLTALATLTAQHFGWPSDALFTASITLAVALLALICHKADRGEPLIID